MPPKASTSISISVADTIEVFEAFSRAYKNLGCTAQAASDGIAELNATLNEYRQQACFEHDIKQIDFHHDTQT